MKATEVSVVPVLSDADARALLLVVQERCTCHRLETGRYDATLRSSSRWCEWHAAVLLDGGITISRLLYARATAPSFWQEEQTRVQHLGRQDDNMTNI